MNNLSISMYRLAKKNKSKTKDYLAKSERIHWAWHFFLLAAVILVIEGQFNGGKFVEHSLMVILHLSIIKQKYIDLLKLGLLFLAGGCIVIWSLRKIITDDWRETILRWREIPPRVDASAIIPEVHFSCFKKVLWLLLSIWIVGVTISLIPGCDALAGRLTKENGVFETLTVVCYLFSGIVALKLLLPLFRRNASRGLLRWWLLALAIGCLFVVSEETNWGDLYFHYKGLDFIRQANFQKDVSMHNIPLPFIGIYGFNYLSQILAIFGGVLLPSLILFSNFFRRFMLLIEAPLPPWITQAFFCVAAIIPQDYVIILQRRNTPSELREITIAIGVAIWLWYMKQNRCKVARQSEIQIPLANEIKPLNRQPTMAG